MNDAFRQQIGIKSRDLDRINAALFNPNSPTIRKFTSFAQKVIASRSQESFYFTIYGNYYQMKIFPLSENGGRHLFRITINDISHDEESVEKGRLDLRLREMNNLYEVIMRVNYKENFILPLLGSYIYLSEVTVSEMSMDEVFLYFSENYVYPADRSDYLTFVNSGKAGSGKKFSSREYIKRGIRVKQRDGSYEWREFSLLSIPGTDRNEFLLTLSKVACNIAEALDKTLYAGFTEDAESTDLAQKEYARIWYNLINNSTYKLFWKDKDRRFRGVSKAFLEFYEINSLDDIIGKNDEEMHWHVDDGPYQGDELDVLNQGKVVNNAQGQCIVNGVVHDIICNKMPIYENGKIVGLVGTFEDMDQEVYRVTKLLNPSRIDNITRLMNSKSFLNVMVDYSAQYNDEGKNYGYIALHNANHRRLENTYGSKFAAKVLKEIAERIIGIIGQKGVAARVKEAYFCVILFEESKKNLDSLAMSLKEHIEAINSIDGKSVTLKMTTVYHLRSDEGITDENIHIVSINEVDAAEVGR